MSLRNAARVLGVVVVALAALRPVAPAAATTALDVALEATAYQSAVAAYNPVDYTVTLTSPAGGSQQAVTVTAYIPGGSGLLIISGADTCLRPVTDRLICELGEIKNWSPAPTLRIRANTSTQQTITAHFAVTVDGGPDANPANDTDTATVTVVARPATVALTQTAPEAQAGEAHAVTATVKDAAGEPSPAGTMVLFGMEPADPNTPSLASNAFALAPDRSGYWIIGPEGNVSAFGVPDLGQAAHPAYIPVGIVATPTGRGYWILFADGTVVTRGDAPAFGSMTGKPFTAPMAGIAATTTGRGYWLADAAGKVIPFGDAELAGTVPAVNAESPIIDIEADPDGTGYWLLDEAGKVYAFDARTYGDAHTGQPRRPASGIAGTPGGRGYWITDWDGNVSAFGDAPFLGSPADYALDAPIVDIRATNAGYVLLGADGFVYPFGTAPFAGPATLGVVRSNGKAVLPFTRWQAGPTTIAASVRNPARVRSGTVTTQWQAKPPGPAAMMMLTPATATATTGTRHDVDVVVRDIDGQAVADGTPIRFRATHDNGASPDSAEVATTGGRARFGFTVEQAGRSEITATTANLQVSGIVEWRAGPPPTGEPPGPPSGGRDEPGNAQPDPDLSTAGGHRPGYWALSSDGQVYNFGEATAYGNTAIGAVDLEPTPSGNGYWTLTNNGRVQSFGDALKLGDVDLGKLVDGESPASLSATPSGKGYWVFTNRGRAIAFGDAAHHGDMSQVKLNGPVLGSVATPSGGGYYMVASDGGIFAFGDAAFGGSMGGKPLNKPVQSLVPDADGKGYWLVASDGGIFAFDAPFRGSMGGKALNKPVVGMVRYGDGYLMVGADGGIFNFSSSPFAGSLGDKPPASPVVAVAALPAS